MRRLAALVCLVLCVSTAPAAVLCARQKAGGIFTATVKIRTACRPSETPLDPDALGLRGPAGPPGPPGDPGACECVSTTTTSTATSPGTTVTSTTLVPACVATIQVDPNGTLAAVVAGQSNTIPVRVTVVSGNPFNLSYQAFESTAGGQCVPTCGTNVGITVGGPGTFDQGFLYVPPAGSSDTSVALTASVQPKGAPFSCNALSQGGTDTKTFAIVP